MKKILSVFLCVLSFQYCHADNNFISNYVFNWADNPKVIEEYLTKSAKDNSISAYILGTLYLTGDILKKDLQRADWYITKAANKNLPEALNSIGDGYYSGDIREKNIDMALYYYEKAAKLGFGPAQFNAGIVLLKIGTTKDKIKKSIFWLDKASKNKDDLKEITQKALKYKKDAETKLKSIK